MSYVIRIVANADGTPSAATGLFIAAYDPDARAGRGDAEMTPTLARALRFETAADALARWRAQAAPPHHLRVDGKPNRPLTAFTVKVEQIIKEMP